MLIVLYAVLSQKKGGEPQKLDGSSDESTAGKMDPGDESGIVDEDDGPWYLGKAKEEFNKRRRSLSVAKAEEEEDPIQVCLHIYSSSVTYCFIIRSPVGQGSKECSARTRWRFGARSLF
jgi:hypothetical protein